MKESWEAITQNGAKTVLVIGAGPAGLMAADRLARSGVQAVLFDAMPSPARKFLLAGRGGLNLTHSEPFETFLTRYGKAAEQLRPALSAFTPQALRDFAAELGEPTFVGTSGRVFPESFKTTKLLRAWLRQLDARGVIYGPRRRFIGFDADANVLFEGDAAPIKQVDAIVFALGGASWPRLGADGGWVEPMRQTGVDVAPLTPANMGLLVDWSALFRDRFAGQPIKAARWRCGEAVSRAEAVVTREGLEGGAIYAISGAARQALTRGEVAWLEVDLAPDRAETDLARRLAGPAKASRSTRLAKAGLSPIAAGLMREADDWPADAEALAARAKRCPVRVAGAAGLARAISTAGGVRWSELDAHFMLAAKPGVFVAGEMIDWEAPTGGYLLQACFATGAAAAQGALQWLASGGQRRFTIHTQMG